MIQELIAADWLPVKNNKRNRPDKDIYLKYNTSIYLKWYVVISKAWCFSTFFFC